MYVNILQIQKKSLIFAKEKQQICLMGIFINIGNEGFRSWI